MNIIAIMGPHGVFYKDEPIKELESALVAQGFQIIWPQNSVDLLKFIEHNPRICGVIFDWDEYSLDLCSDINQLNEYLPLYAFINTHSTMDVSVQDMRMALWFFEYALGQADIAIRMRQYTDEYLDNITPPFTKALFTYVKERKYTFCTPGHMGGTAYQKSPVGCLFYDFFGGNTLKADVSISVTELGSLLDHTGPHLEAEEYIARTFGAEQSYIATNGTSTSNKIVGMYAAPSGSTLLIDRNCHKSLAHLLMMNDVVPVWLKPTRNALGILGGIPRREFTRDSIEEKVAATTQAQWPVHAVITNSTYDGLCYNARRVEELLGQSVDRMHFDEAWYGYARFNPIYKDRFAMYGNPADHKPTDMTVFATQSTHKLLAALSQASFIHIREGKKNVDHSRFNESFMMQASTSPNYPIIASNDITAAMMDGKGGKALTDESIHEAVAFRQLMAKLNADFADQGEWFFNCWQPDFVKDAEGKKIAFRLANPEYLATEPECWVLHPNDAWHGFGDIEDGYCMLDPIKVSITTPGIGPDGLGKMGVPASILSAYLTANGIIPEKTTDFTVLMLFSIGITKGKWGTLIDTLIKFKEDYDNNTALEEVLPDVVKAAPQRYAGMGLRDLCEEMFAAMKELKTTEFMSEGFAVLPHPDMSPAAAYEQLVLDNVEKVDLDGVAERTLATGIVPYPPGIPLIMPGENAGPADGPALGYLKALEGFDRQFPAFEHDSHGVEVENGKYYVTVLKK